MKSLLLCILANLNLRHLASPRELPTAYSHTQSPHTLCLFFLRRDRGRKSSVSMRRLPTLVSRRSDQYSIVSVTIGPDNDPFPTSSGTTGHCGRLASQPRAQESTGLSNGR